VQAGELSERQLRPWIQHSTAQMPTVTPSGIRVGFCILLISIFVSACAGMQLPENKQKALFDKEKMATLDGRSVFASRQAAPVIAANGVCAPAGTSSFLLPQDVSHRHTPERRELTMRYSPGDRLNLVIPGSPEYSGDYAVNADGRVIMPFTGEIDAVGLTNSELSKRIEARLIKSGAFKAEKFLISLRPVLYAPINITVSGAVFLPGRFVINNIVAADKGDKALAKYGDSPIERFVAAALRASGGVRPDADLTRVILRRGKQKFVLNWQGAFTGAPVDDVPLLEGDHLHVEEAPCFQSALVRPSQITPPGIRLFLSNLSVPAASGSNAGTNSQAGGGVPYGTRLLAGLVQANCVGGSRATNAARYAVLISRNPKTLETEVIQRSIEDMVLSPDRDQVNPYLMPDDAIACYDSAMTDARELATTIQAIMVPAQTYRTIRGN
jgi:polysaccharide biosynthesis/export protein